MPRRSCSWLFKSASSSLMVKEITGGGETAFHTRDAGGTKSKLRRVWKWIQRNVRKLLRSCQSVSFPCCCHSLCARDKQQHRGPQREAETIHNKVPLLKLMGSFILHFYVPHKNQTVFSTRGSQTFLWPPEQPSTPCYGNTLDRPIKKQAKTNQKKV